MPLHSTCPISVECKVVKLIETGGDHDFFMGSIEAVHCDEAWLDGDGNLDFSKIVAL